MKYEIGKTYSNLSGDTIFVALHALGYQNMLACIIHYKSGKRENKTLSNSDIKALGYVYEYIEQTNQIVKILQKKTIWHELDNMLKHTQKI